jgi:hypothetical protein
VIEAPQTSDFFNGLLVAMTLGCRRLTRPPFRGCRRLWAAAHIRDVHAERGRQVDLMMLILREALAHLFGELGAADKVPAVWLCRLRSHEKVVQADYHWGPGFFAEIEGCDIGTGRHGGRWSAKYRTTCMDAPFVARAILELALTGRLARAQTAIFTTQRSFPEVSAPPGKRFVDRSHRSGSEVQAGMPGVVSAPDGHLGLGSKLGPSRAWPASR